MTSMGRAPELGRPGGAGFGLGSVGEGSSVGLGKTHYVSSTFWNRNKQLAVLKIRVSVANS
jgi:hypothetical protein